MKTKKRTCAIVFAFVAAILLAFAFRADPPVSVSAAGAYSFGIDSYSVDMTVSADRSVAVREVIGVSFTGYDSHGIIRDFPLGDGVRYRDIEATCDSSDFSPYTQTDDPGFLSLYLRGEGRVTGQTRTYTLTYTMIVPELEEEGYLPLNVIGYGWQATISDVTVRVTVPDGLNAYEVFSGSTGSQGNVCGAVVVREGNLLTVTADGLGYENGITLDLSFEPGALSSSFDWSVLYVLIVALTLLAAGVCVRVFVCRRPDLITTVNLKAPEEMDPLRMGKMIDNKVDGEDLGSLVFWLADQGYLHIDMTESEKNPRLYKTSKPLSADVPSYVRTLYEGLFARRESVRISDLNEKFYPTSNDVITQVNGSVGDFYAKKSKGFIALFALLAVLLFGGFALLLPMAKVFSGYYYWYAFVVCAIAFALPAAAGVVASQRMYKWKKIKCAALGLLGVLGAVLVSCVSFLLPSPAFGSATAFLLGIASALVGGVAGTFLCRTKEYTEKLGQILGFKQFILFTERDRIEFMLKDNPELYYHVLPYAQVLGVTDQWTEKFKGLDMKAPSYVSYGTADFLIDCFVWHTVFRSLSTGMARYMISRPSSSGRAGGHGGGFGGGFSGGGFGGGGGRGC